MCWRQRRVLANRRNNLRSSKINCLSNHQFSLLVHSDLWMDSHFTEGCVGILRSSMYCLLHEIIHDVSAVQWDLVGKSSSGYVALLLEGNAWTLLTVMQFSWTCKWVCFTAFGCHNFGWFLFSLWTVVSAICVSKLKVKQLLETNLKRWFQRWLRYIWKILHIAAWNILSRQKFCFVSFLLKSQLWLTRTFKSIAWRANRKFDARCKLFQLMKVFFIEVLM